MSDKLNIGVFTSFDVAFKSVGDITYPVLEKYCEKHGYNLNLLTERISDRFIMWEKIKFVYDNLDKYDWLVWLDSDILVTNFTTKLESFIDEDYNFTWARDCHAENSGMFIIRGKCNWSKEFLNDVWNIDPNHPIYNFVCHWSNPQCEQSALKVYSWSDKYKDKVKVVSQILFNSYLYELYDRPATTEGNWTKNSFCLHLPGVNNERRVEIFNQKLGEIIYE